ncbi:hypothetical protein NQ315_002464 [Exocentrus adspersus]|uniref:DDE Tnp4 domain-containing protein n=1 Tax=Exocentrus adspersus TaxID=1586481 RepID=A0AAV8VKN7_9CUCU|nr:hypothetical protein NQ315_002464 [Exocentrus adspersus]
MKKLNCSSDLVEKIYKDYTKRYAFLMYISLRKYLSVLGFEGLCICLRRLAYPNRLLDLEQLFGLSAQSISRISRWVVNFINDNYSYLLRDLHNIEWLNYNRLQQYAQAIRNKGAPLNNCWGFIDGIARAICRPSVEQENYFSGHKRFHCVKYQSIMCPDGIIVHLSTAYPGRRHDAGIFRETNLHAQLEECTTFPNGQTFVLYGDQAYGIRRLLLCPYGNVNLTPEQQLFNIQMSAVRQSVECGFGKVLSEFAFLDFKKNKKLLLQDINEMYTTGTIFTNCHTCLYGSQTSHYFNMVPPQLEQYLTIM